MPLVVNSTELNRESNVNFTDLNRASNVNFTSEDPCVVISLEDEYG